MKTIGKKYFYCFSLTTIFSLQEAATAKAIFKYVHIKLSIGVLVLAPVQSKMVACMHLLLGAN